ncbi:Alpha/Beta hydrolase protein [Podospora conica]|nr:Alpha/Beta hydrolase protein [Schizothecium conicum]
MATIHSLSDSKCNNSFPKSQKLGKPLPSHMMVPSIMPSIVGKLSTLHINRAARTLDLLPSAPHQPTFKPFHGNYNLDNISRIIQPERPSIMASQWSNIKAAELENVPSPLMQTLNSEGNPSFCFLEFEFKVPLDYSKPASMRDGKISLHATLVYDDVTDPKHAAFKPVPVPVKAGPGVEPGSSHPWKGILQSRKKKDLLLYLCGGPGDANPWSKIPPLLRVALEDGYHVLFVDYRGTGKDSIVTPDKDAEFISMFRQDNIVRDLEAIRLCLEKDEPGLKFTLLGQSFGGWVITTYLSFLPSSIKTAAIHAGLPPIGCGPEKVYKSIFEEVITRNKAYYKKYPDDKALVHKIVRKLETAPQQYTDKDSGTKHTVTGRTFMTVGRSLGAQGGDGSIHNLVVCMSAELENGGKLSDETFKMYLECQSFKLDQRPLYGVIHEAIYCYGPQVASKWAAQKVAKQQGEQFSWVDETYDLKNHTGELYFSGEMIFPFMLRNSGVTLAAFEEVAHKLAQKEDWPVLYNPVQLAVNEVEVVAVVYTDDMYVSGDLARKAGGMIRNFKEVTLPAGFGHKSIKDEKNAAEVFRKFFPKE